MIDDRGKDSFTISLPKSLGARLRLYTKKNGASLNSVIGIALDEYLLNKGIKDVREKDIEMIVDNMDKKKKKVIFTKIDDKENIKINVDEKQSDLKEIFELLTNIESKTKEELMEIIKKIQTKVDQKI